MTASFNSAVVFVFCVFLLLFLFKQWCAYLQRYLVVAWLVPRETAAVSAHVLCTPYTHAPIYSGTSFHVDMDEVATRATGGTSWGGGGVKFSASVQRRLLVRLMAMAAGGQLSGRCSGVSVAQPPVHLIVCFIADTACDDGEEGQSLQHPSSLSVPTETSCRT